MHRGLESPGDPHEQQRVERARSKEDPERRGDPLGVGSRDLLPPAHCPPCREQPGEHDPDADLDCCDECREFLATVAAEEAEHEAEIAEANARIDARKVFDWFGAACEIARPL